MPGLFKRPTALSPRWVDPTETVGIALKPEELFVETREKVAVVDEIDRSTPPMIGLTSPSSGRSGANALFTSAGLDLPT